MRPWCLPPVVVVPVHPMWTCSVGPRPTIGLCQRPRCCGRQFHENPGCARPWARSGIVGLGVSGWERAGRVPRRLGRGVAPWWQTPAAARSSTSSSSPGRPRRPRACGPSGSGRARGARRVDRESSLELDALGEWARRAQRSVTCRVGCAGRERRAVPQQGPPGRGSRAASLAAQWETAEGTKRQADRRQPAAVQVLGSRPDSASEEGEPPESALELARAGRRRPAPTSRSEPGPGPVLAGGGLIAARRRSPR